MKRTDTDGELSTHFNAMQANPTFHEDLGAVLSYANIQKKAE